MLRQRNSKMKQSIHSTALFLVLLLGGTGDGRAARDLAAVSSWGYQLQQADPIQMRDSLYDMLIMDYSRDGTDQGAYTQLEIQSIKEMGKLVLAYLSVGEAEDYRFYWETRWKPGNPAWLGPLNPKWPGNYKVRYWQSGWWNTVLQPYLQRILAAGFDGVYLDIVDAYWYWHQEQGISLSLTSKRMVELVERIAVKARSVQPGFLVCPQNAESIIDDVPTVSYRKRYLKVLSAIGVEDLFYHYGSFTDHKYRLRLLQQYAQAGIKVFDVEYLARKRWQEYRSKICATSITIIPYAAAVDRELDELISFPPASCPAAEPQHQ